MKKINLLFAVILFLLTNVYAQNPARNVRASLTGKISAVQTNSPLHGASIYIPDLRAGTTADESGNYTLRNLPAGRYLVEVSFIGFSSIVETIDLGTNTQKDFTLTPSLIENENITITGVSTGTSTKRNPVPINIIRKENLFNNVATNLIDNLSKTPGVSQVSTGPAASKPFIRGLGYNRVVVVNDGIRQEGQQWGDEHGIEIDELNASRVEVLKGPASLMYGSNALAGVVNIISFQTPPQGVVKGNIMGGYQTNNRQRNLHGDMGGNINGFVWGASGSFKAAADYKNKYDGYVFNSKFNEKNFGGYVGLNKHWGYSHLYVTNFNQELGLVEGDRDDLTGKFLKRVNNNGVGSEQVATDKDFRSTDPYIPKQRIKHFKIATDNSFKIGANRLTVVLGYQRNQRQEFGNILDPAEKALHFDLNTIDYNLQYHFPENRSWKSTIGINGMQQTNHNKGEEALIPEYSLFDIGGFWFIQKRMNKLSLSGGIRFDNRSLHSERFVENSVVKFPSFTKNFSNISGSAGLAYEAGKTVTLKFNLARGFRAPSIAELASNGAHEGTNRFEYGEQQLKSETSFQADAGIEIGSEHVSFNANIFYNTISNFIYYRKLESRGGGDSVINIGTEQFFAFRFAQNNAHLYGTEFNFDIHPHPFDWLHIDNTFSWVRGMLNKEQDGSKNLPFIPAARLINEVKVEFAKKGTTLNKGFVMIQLDNTFGQNHPFTGYNTETPTPGYSLINAAIGGNIVSKGKPLFSLFFGANNVTDVAYQNHMSRLKYAPENLVTGRRGVFNMGRNFSVKVNVPLDFSRRS
ncbi:MAG TPA: TonB-dependent receptor [Chitinophagaceae bacterium]|nr:TonB-dependent receptor [Chitinophagaceae bacterium]